MTTPPPREPGDQSPDPNQNPEELFQQLFSQLGLGGESGQVDLNQLAEKLQALMQQGGMPGMGLPGMGGMPGMATMPGFGGLPGMGFGPGASTSDDALDWTQVRQHTRQLSAAAGPDPTPSLADQKRVADATRLAELWLDEVCEFGQVTATPQVWSRAEWIESTALSWKPVVEPIVSSLSEAMMRLMDQPSQAGEAGDPFAALGQMLQPMMRQMAAGMYQLQFCQALASLSGKVVTGAELGFQLLPEARVTLLEKNMTEQFGDLELPADDVRLYLLLREAARQRLFAHVGWLAPQLLALVEHYARETQIDQRAVESVFDTQDLESLDPTKLAELSSQLQGKLFEPSRSPEQVEVLARLETLLALTEGWVDELVSKAASAYLPNHAALAETWRRRRGAGGPAEEVFQSLMGLELRPRRVRDAANVWAAVTELRGQAAREQLWSHPDLLPTAADLDDPVGFAQPGSGAKAEDDMDRALAALLAEEGKN